MAIRLASFLSELEDALRADETPLKGGSWDNQRIFNYNLGLARFSLASRTARGSDSLGSILIQAFDLADGSCCVKANLQWAGREDAPEAVHTIYQQPAIDWKAEAARVAAAWVAGPPAPVEIKLEVAEPLAVAS